MTLNDILVWIGQTTLSGIAIYAVIQWLAQKWIEARLSERLAEFHFRLDSLQNRITKIHQKEFEVLPEIWSKLQTALGYVTGITKPLQSYSDISTMTIEEISDHLQEEGLTGPELRVFLSSINVEWKKPHERQSEYTKTISLLRIRQARNKVTEFHNYLLYNRIFLNNELYEQLADIDGILSSTALNTQIGTQHDQYDLVIQAWKELQEKTQSICREIEESIRQRLRYYDAD